jgi:thioredoxin 1
MGLLTEENFDGVIKENSLVLVDFYADWCGPCKMMAPIVEEIASEVEGKVAVGKVNVDESSGLASKYQVFSIPTFVIFKDGKEIDRLVGAVGKEGILKALQKHMA